MSIVKNYSYNLIYQVTLILIPVISIPYISRVIGSQGIGIYAYTNSVAQYFILFANLGLALYASREIAYVKNDIPNRSKVFSEIVTLQFFSTIFVLLIYYAYVSLFCVNYKAIYFIQSLSIISVAFDISWLYIGMENFKKNVIRNLVVKISAFILLFLVVKTPDDLWKYVALSVGSILLGQLYMWIGIGKFINKISFKHLHLLKHLKKALNFFLIVSIGIIGVNLNKTLIGLYVNKSELGKYEMAYRIITMSLIIVTSLGSVMTPRISATYGEGNKEKVNEYLKMSLQFILFFCFLIIPLTIGVSGNFVKWFLGAKFDGAELYLVILAPMILFNSLSNLLSNQYMIPSGNEKKFVLSLIVGGTLGILSSFLLVSKFSTIGACIAVLIGEMAVLGAHVFQTRGDKELYNILGNWWQFLLASLPILLVSWLLRFLIVQPILLTFSQMLASVVIYTLLLLLFKNVFIHMIYLRIRSMLFTDLKV